MTALAFLIAIKSPAVATSWPEYARYVERTLRSVCRQTSGDFRVVVICNRMPDINFTSDRLTVIAADFPSPGDDYSAKVDDKKKKIVTGLISLAGRPPRHVMVVDSDDCISRDLVRHVAAQPDVPGWYIDQGYEYPEGSRFIRWRDQGFFKICGSSVIARYDLVRFQPLLAPDEPLGDNDRFLTGHPHAEADFAARGAPLRPLPFPGAVYIRDDVGESITKQEPIFAKLKRNPREVLRGLKLNTGGLRDLRPLTDAIRDEFGLTPLPAAAATELRAGDGSLKRGAERAGR